MGGLGNNLSQLFFAYILQSKGYKVEVNNYLCSKNIVTRILKWYIHDQSVKTIYNQKFKLIHTNLFLILFDLLLLNISKIFNGWCYNRLFDANQITSFDEFQKTINSKYIVLAGYWQRLNIYNENAINQFRNFLFSNIELNHSKKLCVHIRGGDFIKFNKSLQKSYYRNALAQVKDCGAPTIFTNDKIFSGALLADLTRHNFLENGNSKEDFLNMISFNQMICSNSTFSIWAGLISLAERIIIPKSDGISLKLNIDVQSFNSKKITII
jgi:hypothetical protein|tara:strand:+ start:3725 stop:4528 length:804 start_codon:yes stop_codon:yes gene_type:complete